MTMRTSIATVCLSGTLIEKLHACAEAGFDGVEVFEPDLVASPASPEEVAALAGRLGLSLDLYQPFRDAEGVTDDGVRARCCTAPGPSSGSCSGSASTPCSSAATSAPRRSTTTRCRPHQLRRLGDEAEAHGVRLAYEALAWGRFVDDYRRAWRIVELADHPAVGRLPRQLPHPVPRPRPRRDRADPGRQDLLPAARRRPGADHGRAVLEPAPPAVPRRGGLRPRERSSATSSRAGYPGPLSLEVFNDTFRQTDVLRTADQAKRSLTWLEDQVAQPRGRPTRSGRPARPGCPTSGSPPRSTSSRSRPRTPARSTSSCGQLGFTFRGHHRTKPVRLWTQGRARVVCNEQTGP